MKTIKKYQLKEITTFHLPAVCNYFCEYDNIEELKEILTSSICKENKIIHIGGGSNLLFTRDFDGVILHSKIKFTDKIEDTEDCVILKVGSGVVWDEFVEYCVSNGYSGTENLSYIPGEVGASAIQNIGSYGAEVKDIIHKVHTIKVSDLSERIFDNEECQYDYRNSIFKNEYKDKYIVTAVEYKLQKTPSFILEYGPLKSLDKNTVTLKSLRNEIIKIRCSKLPDPKHIGSVGSFFKNPIVEEAQFKSLLANYPNMPHYQITDDTYKIPAGWLIENSGMKGAKIGNAQVYEKQCLVIVNNGNAVAEDVVKLYTKIIEEVGLKFNIHLSPEANIL